jgi:dipeptidyl aminopeptidase/acylaminoacyl peptidase
MRSAVVLWLAILSLICQAAAAPPRRAVSVDDIVEFTQVDSIGSENFLSVGERSFSPDRLHFFIVTHRGDLASGLNVYDIRVYETTDIDALLRRTKSFRDVRPVATATLGSATNEAAIGQVQWSADSRKIFFLGQTRSSPAQVYSLDIASSELSQETEAPGGILSYGASGDTFVYYAFLPRSLDRRQVGFAVTDQPLLDILTGEQSASAPPAQLFVRRRGEQARPLALGPLRTNQFGVNNGIWVSGDGAYAVVKRTAERIPPEWEQYRFFQGSSASLRRSPPEGDPNPRLMSQFVVVDLRTREAVDFIDAPTLGLPVVTAPVHWLSDNSGFILFNARMPLRGASAEQSERWVRTASVAQYDLATRRLQEIVGYDLVENVLEIRRVVAFNPRSDTQFSVEWATPGGSPSSELYARDSSGRWALADPQAGIDLMPYRLEVVQALNDPPEVYVSRIGSARRARLTDLNPALRRLRRGVARSYNWQSADGTAWRGGLVLPPGYVRGRRYPLVIQTHGFNPSAFQLEGPDTTGEAAQALASAGFIVLMVPNNYAALNARNEAELHMASYEAAVDSLDRDGLIDRNAIGIAGFSRTYFHVIHAAAFSRLRFAAINASDGVDAGYMNYLETLNEPAGDLQRRWAEKINSGDPITNVGTWLASSPVFNSRRICGAVRIETTRRRGAFYRWELFSRLRLSRQPVDMFVIEDGVHSLVKPRERQATMQGMVDWFSFWILNRERPDPEARSQYERWRQLRSATPCDRSAQSNG